MHALLVQLSRRSADPHRPQANPGVSGISLLGFPSLFLWLFLLSCSTAGNENVTVVDARSGSGSQTIQASTEERRFLLIPFSAPQKTSDSSYDYNLNLDVRERTPTPSAKPTVQNSSQNRLSLETFGRLARRVERESALRRLDAIHMNEAIRKFETSPELFSRFYKSRRPSFAPKQAAAATIQIHSPFDGESGTELTGTLRVSSSRTAIYVDSRVNDSVDTSSLTAMMQGFDEISFPRLHALFGQESDIDDNGVINVFLADPEKVGADVIGFFRPADLLPNGTVTGVKSNEMEIVYVRTPGTGFDFELAQATVAHEAYHLINFAEKSLPLFQSSGGTLPVIEQLFLNEGEAHLAEDLAGWGIGTPMLVQIYLQCLTQTSVGGGGITEGEALCEIAAPGNDSLARRGGTTLLLLYMFQQLGGAQYSTKTPGDVKGQGVSFLQRLTSSNAVGIPNLEETSGRSFFSWYGDFAATLALDASGVTNDSRYNFALEATDPFTGLVRNIRVRSTRTDASGTVTLDGPAVLQETTASSNLAINGSLFVTGANAIRLTVPANIEIVLSVGGDTSLALGMTIARAP